MKYLKKFQTQEEYNHYVSQGIEKPNVSYVTEDVGVRYTPLTWSCLIGDGSAYIRTDYHLNIYDEIEVQYIADTIPGMVLGVRDSNVYGLILQSQKWEGYVVWGDNSSTLLSINSVSKEPVFLGMKKSGPTTYYSSFKQSSTSKTLKQYTAPADVTAATRLCIFTSSQLDTDNEVDKRIFQGKIYYVKVTDSRTGDVKMELRPHLQNGIAGLYDLVSNKFYTNANSVGTFTLGTE